MAEESVGGDVWICWSRASYKWKRRGCVRSAEDMRRPGKRRRKEGENKRQKTGKGENGKRQNTKRREELKNRESKTKAKA